MFNRQILPGILILIFIVAAPCSAFASPFLQWDASTGEVTGYRVYYGTTQGGPYPASREVASNSCNCDMVNLSLQEKTTYYFVVRAYNAAGESGNSNEATYTVPDTTPPAVPQGVSAQ